MGTMGTMGTLGTGPRVLHAVCLVRLELWSGSIQHSFLHSKSYASRFCSLNPTEHRYQVAKVSGKRASQLTLPAALEKQSMYTAGRLHASTVDTEKASIIESANGLLESCS